MRIIILEDHTLFAHGIREIIKNISKEVEVKHYTSTRDLTEKVHSIEHYDLLISDVELKEENALNFIASICTKIPVLVLSMHLKKTVILKCKKMGIKGYMLKDDSNIKQAVSRILSGKTYYSKPVLKILEKPSRSNTPVLTLREEEILRLISAGKKSIEIAEALFISENTVKTHRKNIHAKLGLSSIPELINYYHKNYL